MNEKRPFYLKYLVLTTSLFFAGFTLLFATGPEELGQVKWIRNMSDAKLASIQSKRPILILFQEVPGCATCKRYGNTVLSHPLIVEAIESHFVPLAIFNNKRGSDAEILDYYKEPSWNNPVVRVVGSDMKDLQARLDGNYRPSGLVEYMINALRKSDAVVPGYLSLLLAEFKAEEKGLEKATLSMYCFWTGEKELGKLNGVVHTEAGFMDHHEVVNVFYDPSEIKLEEIIREGKSTQCADAAYLSDNGLKKEAADVLGDDQVRDPKSFLLDRDPKYYLSKTKYQYVPMSPMQAVKSNALVGLGRSPDHMLSPRQLAIAKYAEQGKTGWSSVIHAENWQKELRSRWESIASQ